MGMTRKSNSRRSSFPRYRSWNSSGSSFNLGQNPVSKSFTLRFPQTWRDAQSQKKCLFQLDESKTIKKWTHWSPRVICESESHFQSSFNLSISRMENFSKLGSRNFTQRTFCVVLCIWRSVGCKNWVFFWLLTEWWISLSKELSLQRIWRNEHRLSKRNMLKERKTSLMICIARPQALRKLHLQKLETAAQGT